MKYVYNIDKYNSIFIDDDDQAISQTGLFMFIDSIGWDISYQSDDTLKRRIARRELAKIFHARNFYMWERMKEERGNVFCI